MSQPNELAWVKASLRALDLVDRIGPPAPAPRVMLDAYGWAREFWVGGQHEFHRALGAQFRRIAEQRQRWAMLLLVASVALAAGLSATDIFDQMTGRASTVMAWAERGSAFVADHGSFLPAGIISFVAQFAGQTYPVVVFVIGLLPGLAAVIAGYAMQMAFKARSRRSAQMAWLFERGLEVLPEPHHVGRKSIVAGVLEPELSAYCEAIFVEARHRGNARERRLDGDLSRSRDRLTSADAAAQTNRPFCAEIAGPGCPGRVRAGGPAGQRETSAVGTACRRRCSELRLRSSWRW